MLNPTATEFQPSSSFQQQSTKVNVQSNAPNASTANIKSKKTASENDQQPGQDRKPSKSSHKKPESRRQSSATDTSHGKKSSTSKSKPPNEAKAKTDGAKSRTPASRTARAGKGKSLDGRAAQIAASVKTNSTSKVQNFEPTDCITIMEAIEPVNLVPGEGSTLNIINGCELYVQWIGRCFQQYEEVTLIGIDQAIADAISVINILQDSEIGGYHEVTTFSLEESRSVSKSCILFKLHQGAR